SRLHTPLSALPAPGAGPSPGLHTLRPKSCSAPAMRTPCAVAPCLPFRPQLLPSLTLTLLSMPQFRLSQQLTALPCPWARLELAAAVGLLTPQHWMLMQTPSPVKTVFWQLRLVRSCPSWVWWKKHQRPQRPTTPCSRPSRPSLVPVGQRPSPHPSTRSAQCF